MASEERDGTSNTAAISVECMVKDLGLSQEDAEYLVSLGVGCSGNDDALSVLGHALTAATERAQELEAEVERLLLEVEEAEEALDKMTYSTESRDDGYVEE